MQMIFRPFGARERPFVLGPLEEFFAGVADLQQHLRPLVPAVRLAVQEMIEERKLLLAAVVGVEMGPVLDAVRLEPLLLRGGADEPLEIAARVQPLAAPVRGREQWYGHPRPHRRARLVVRVIEWMIADLVAEIGAVGGEPFLRQGLRPAYQLAMHAASLAALARPVLHGL